MAKYKAYPEYKDSGVEWLGAIPDHWKISKLRYQFDFGKGLTITKEHLQDEGIPCVNYGEVHSKYGFEIDPKIHTLKCVSDKYLKDNLSSLLAKGDIVFADTSEDIDGSGNFTQLVSNTITFAGYHTIIARPFERENSRFYAYLLDCKELRSQVRHAVKGVKVFSVTQAILRNLSIWLPSKDEQAQISAFLDHETAKIDNLIEKQQQLIELLKEKRQAVISHAVTKGLTPDVPMKDSGVEWLGEVPEHWVVSKVKYYCTIKGRIGFRGYTVQDLVDENEGALVLGASEMRSDGSILLSSPQYISWKKYYESPEIMLEKNMILFVQRGSTVGKVSFINHDLGKATINPSLIVMRDLNIHGEFMSYSLMSSFIQNTVKTQTSSTAIPMISQEQVGNYFQLIPPLNEQLRIAEYIASDVSKIDQAINTAEISISLIKERRIALISAAVTGKIDVRDWVAPETQDLEEPQEATA